MIRPRLAMMLAAVGSLSGQDFLEPMVVTASRAEEPASRALYSADFIGSESIRDNSRRTLPEVLQFTPGVFVQKTAHGHGSPFIRGFTGRQNLLLLDGVRLNNSTFRSGPVQYWNSIDPFVLDHIELVRSQGSVLYGSDAIGGTLNAFTKPTDFAARKADAVYQTGAASYEFRSNGQGSHLGRIESEAGIGGRFGVRLGLSAKEFGDIRDSAVGRMKGSGYPEWNADFRTDVGVTPDSRLTFAFNHTDQDGVERWHRTLDNPGWTHGRHLTSPGKWTANRYDIERSLAYLRYSGEDPRADAAVARWTATLSWQKWRDSEFQNRNPDDDSIRQADIDTDTFGLDLSLESPVGPGSMVYGIDYYHDRVDSSGFASRADGSGRRELLPLADDSRYDLLGLFGQYIWRPTASFDLSTGARYTRAHAALGRFYDSTGVLQTDRSESWDSVVGSLRAVYRWDNGWNVYGGVSQAFRAPNLDDLSGNQAARSGATALGSTSLDPEEFITYEIGTRRTAETSAFGFSFFYTDADQIINAVPVADGDPTTINVNATDAYVYGFELDGSWRFHPQWTLSGFVAWQDSRISTPAFLGGLAEDKPATRQLPLTSSLAVRWTAESGRHWIEGRVLAAATEDRITAADQAADSQRIPTHGTPGYTVVSLRGGWQVNEFIDLTCGLENLTDEDHRTHGSGQNESGFNAIVGARVNW